MAITWEEIVEKRLNDKVLSTITRCIKGRSLKHDQSLSAYFRYDDALYLSDRVILYQDRMPINLRSLVLNKLHSAHQGVTSMHNCAQQIVFWPGITQDIESIRVNCQNCNRNSLFQPSLTREASDSPTSLFEKIFTDFFQFVSNIF